MLQSLGADYGRNVTGWLADLFRCAWGLFYWNLRKTHFRMNRGHVPCPCQNPSDSGRAMETACDASLSWNRTARFVRICPLLKRNTAGQLRCSVNTAEVRPFWGRAFGYFVGATAGIYLLGALLTLGGLRVVGYPINFRQVAWPGAWSEFHQVQSRYFAAKATRAFAEKNVSEALVALSLAYQLDPQNYTTGSTLARRWQSGQPILSDRVYNRLMLEHPSRRGETLAAWYQALLIRGDFKAIIPLVCDAIKNDPARVNAWLYALFFALHREPDGAVWSRLANDSTLPDELKSLWALERLTETSPRAAAHDALLTSSNGALPYLAYYRPQRLIELGFANDALELLGKSEVRARRGDEVIGLRLEAYAALGWTSVARSEMEALLGAATPSAGTVELLCAHLVRHPNRELLATLLTALRRGPLPAVSQNYSAYTALLCATGASGDFEGFHEALAAARKITGGDFKALSVVETFFRETKNDVRVETYLPALQPLSLDVTYAMLERYYRSRPASPSSATTP